MGAALQARKAFARKGEIRYPVFPRRERESPSMNAFADLSMKSDEVLRVELEEFRRQHRDLDEAITALEEKGARDPLTIRRLKQQKLRLKDMITYIEDRLYPDIIA
jgi:hypothetical protein